MGWDVVMILASHRHLSHGGLSLRALWCCGIGHFGWRWTVDTCMILDEMVMIWEKGVAKGKVVMWREEV